MSVQARKALVESPKTFFQLDSQRADLLDENKTQTELIALLQDLVDKGWLIEFTAIRSDHHDDGSGPGYHASGYAADCWPLASEKAGDYLDPSTHAFRQFLVDASRASFLMQIGLGGSANTPENQTAAGPTVFSDDSQDHVHVGARSRT